MNVALPRLAICASMLLASCGPEPLTLPDQPVDRAATCGIVAAAQARLAVTDVSAPLPLAEHGRIVDYALLAATASGEYDTQIAGAVSQRMQTLQNHVTSGEWQPLAASCKAAYPAAEKQDVTLPEDEFDAQLQCNELARFMSAALSGQASSYRNEIADYRHLHERLNDRIAPALNAKAGTEVSDQRKLRHRALADASRLGAPIATLSRCLERFR
ncbi:MAG: hypothetical protein ACXW2T_00570 [Allosphingosinicella sp.]